MSNASPISGNDLSTLLYLLGVPAVDLQRILGLTGPDWGMYVRGKLEDGSSPILSEPAISILVRLYMQNLDACPIKQAPHVVEVLEKINSDRITKKEVRDLEAERGIKPDPSLSYAERAKQLGCRLFVTTVKFTLVLGRENSAGNRWLRGAVPPPAIRNLLIYINEKIDSDGDSRVFEEIEKIALEEAEARGIKDLEATGSWGALPKNKLRELIVK